MNITSEMIHNTKLCGVQFDLIPKYGGGDIITNSHEIVYFHYLIFLFFIYRSDQAEVRSMEEK